MESSSSEFSSLDLGEFDWALLSKEWNIKSQPYLQIPKLVACEQSAGKYYSDNDIVKSSTDAAKSSLKKFKQAVLDKCQSSFGTFYQSCFDELLGFNADVKSDATIEENSLPEEKEKSRRIAKITGEIERRAKQPGCLNKFVVFNEPKRSREGRFCQCSETEKLTGIHHDIYPGETAIPHCVRDSNNLDKLTHYVLKVTKLSNNSAQPSTYFEVKDEIYYFE
uniref:Uncharacterized protein n=1 Tax=Panagrolaimus sp. JU765 TaxID=591449 RepID=A0AC34Q8X5_9BILA